MEELALFLIIILPFVVLIWAVLVGLFIYALRLATTGRKIAGYTLGIPVILVAAVILLKPEIDDVSRFFQQRTIAALPRSATTLKPPYHLHIIGTSAEDSAVLALAETGLFNVTTAWGLPPGRYSERIVVDGTGDCLKRRTGLLRFTAATGFTRCAHPVREAGALPARYLALWIGVRNPILMDIPQRNEQRALNLWEVDGKTEKLLAYWETSRPLKRSLLSRLLPYGLRETDTREANSMRAAYKAFDPDILKFVFETLRLDPNAISVPEQKSSQELASFAIDLLTREPRLSPETAISGLAVLGAIGMQPTEADAALNAIVEKLFANNLTNGMRIENALDCRSADVVIAHRQAASKACSARALKDKKSAGDIDCLVPVRHEDYRELCRSGFRDEIWPGGQASGTKVLIAWPKSSYESDIRIGEWTARVTVIDIPKNSGPLDLALVSSGARLWYFTGSTECVAKVSVASPRNGVIGVSPDRVHFRYREGADVQPVSMVLNSTLSGMLGASADLSLNRPDRDVLLDSAVSTVRDAPAACGSVRHVLKPDVRNGLIAIDPDNVVSDPIMVPFKVP